MAVYDLLKGFRGGVGGRAENHPDTREDIAPAYFDGDAFDAQDVIGAKAHTGISLVLGYPRADLFHRLRG